MNQKGFANIVLIILVVILVGAGIYFVSTRQTTPLTPTPAPTSTPTTTQLPNKQTPASSQTDKTTNWKTYTNTNNWKTYTNTKYNYQIKYPADWTVEINGVAVSQNQVPNPELGKGIMFFGTKKEPYGKPARTLWNMEVFVSNPLENPKKLSPRDWYVEQSKLQYLSYGFEQKSDLEDITFKGLPALKITLKIKGEKTREGSNLGDSLLIAKGTLLYSLAFGYANFDIGEFDTPSELILSEILDSFILN